MSEQQNLEVVQEVYSAFGRGDLPGLLAMLEDEVDWRLPGPAPYAGHRRGHSEVQDFFTKLLEAAEIEHFAPQEFLAKGNTVVVLGEERLRARSTGRVLTQQWAHVFTVRNGKIAAIRMIEDTAGHAAIFDASPETLRAQLGPMGVSRPPVGITEPAREG
jgi:ketosteroid isomerase-like protein